LGARGRQNTRRGGVWAMGGGGGYNVGDVKREKEGGTRGKRDRKGRKGGKWE
jgi:hypothetical protein